MTLFDEEESATLTVNVAGIILAYRERLLLNPPTPAFNTNTNPRAEAFARAIAPKDVTRFLAVLDDMGLTIVPKRTGGVP